jgi:hypothetical protein
MRYIYVHVLRHGGKTEWRIIPWGKAHLDYIREQGGVIIGYHEV